MARCCFISRAGGGLLGCRPRFFLMHRRAGACPPRSCSCPPICSSGSPDPERIKSRRSCPTERAVSVYRRARACPSPCLGRGNGVGWRAIFAQVGRSRGTGPRATVCKAVSFHRRARPVPRHATIGKTALVGVRFSRRSNARGGQAPALRTREGFSSPCPVREQALPNYSLLLILLIVIILKILLLSGSKQLTWRGKAALGTHLQLIPNARIICTRYEFPPRKRKNDDRLFSH